MLKWEETVEYGVAGRTQGNHTPHFFGAAKKHIL